MGEQKDVAHTSHSRKGGEERFQSFGKSEVDNQTNLSHGGVKMKKVMQFLRDEEGSNAIEYGLIASLIGLVIILSVTGVGTALKAVFTKADSTMTAAAQ